MRALPLLIVPFALGCQGMSRTAETPRASRTVAWDSSAARRLCQSPDSVIAGTKECVLLDQGFRPDVRRFPRPTP